MSRISSHEEHSAEYTDRIAAMEEELKKVRQPQTCPTFRPAESHEQMLKRNLCFFNSRWC